MLLAGWDWLSIGVGAVSVFALGMTLWIAHEWDDLFADAFRADDFSGDCLDVPPEVLATDREARGAGGGVAAGHQRRITDHDPTHGSGGV